MVIVDIVVALLLLFGLFKGIKNGIIKEVAFFAAIILGIFVSKLFSPIVAEYVYACFHWEANVCLIVSYSLLFVGIALSLNLVASLLSKLMKHISLGWLNKLLGAGFGVMKYALIVSVLFNMIIMLKLDSRLMEETVLFSPIAAILEQVLAFAETIEVLDLSFVDEVIADLPKGI